MTYQELVKNYPWIDLAWEIFKGAIIPTVVALITVLLTEHFIRKRNELDKRKEMQLQYLEKILSWIHDTRRNIFKVNSAFAKALNIKNPEERVKKYNKNVKKLNKMNECVFVWCNTYNDIAKSFGYDFKLKQLKESINYYSKQITDIGLKGENPQIAIDEISTIIHIVEKEIQESISILVEIISSLYGNKKYKKWRNVLEKRMKKDKGDIDHG